MATLTSKYKERPASIGTAIQSVSDMVARAKWFRDEAVRRDELKFNLKVTQGIATFDDEISFLRKQMKWYDRFSSNYAELENRIQDVADQKKETEIQFQYKTRQITDEDLLRIRQEELATTKEGSQKNYGLKTEIDDIQRRIQQRADTQAITNATLLYKNNFASATQHRDFLQAKYDDMVASGKYTEDELFSAKQELEQQKINVVDLANEAQRVTDEMNLQNGVDRAASLQQYITNTQQLLTDERDPIERIRIQGRIDAATEELRVTNRDRSEMGYRIQYAKGELSDQEFSQKLFDIADAETNPDDKLKYQLEASKTKKEATDKTFDKEVQSIKNQFERDQDSKKVLDSFNALKAKYGNDDEIQFKLDALIASQERDIKNKDFEQNVQELQDAFAINKNQDSYVAGLRSMLDSYGDDLALGSQLRSLIAKETGDLNDEKFNSALQDIANRHSRKEITDEQYITEIDALRRKPEFAEFIGSTQYASQLDRILATQSGQIQEQSFTNELERLATLRSNYSITDEQYLNGLNAIKSNSNFANILRSAEYQTRLDGIIGKTEGAISDNRFTQSVNNFQNQFNARTITHDAYVAGLEQLRRDNSENPDYSNRLDGMIAQLKGDQKTVDFTNKLAGYKQKYDSGEWTTKKYLDTLKQEQAKYVKGGVNDDFYRKLDGLIAPMTTTLRDENYKTDLLAAENKYKKNQTTVGLNTYLADIQTLKTKYTGYSDIQSDLASREADLQGNVVEAQFSREVADLQKKLQAGKLESPNKDYGTSTYLAKLNEIKAKYFGKDVAIKPSQKSLDLIDNELNAADGSETRTQLSRKLQNLNDEWATGKIDDNAYRAELVRLRDANAFGQSLDVKQLFGDDIFRVETNLAQKSYESFTKDLTKQRTDIISEQQRRFARAEQEFKNIQAQYGAGQVDFGTYESAQKKLGEQTQMYEDYKTRIQGEEYKLPEFKFEIFKPDSTLEKPKYKLPELFNF